MDSVYPFKVGADPDNFLQFIKIDFNIVVDSSENNSWALMKNSDIFKELIFVCGISCRSKYNLDLVDLNVLSSGCGLFSAALW